MSRWAPFRERLLSRLIIDPETGCVEWTGPRTAAGYGVIKRDGKAAYVHRVMYELFAGPIPAGLQIDHLCRNRACSNVTHLDVVTQQVNVQRGLAGSLKTSCPKGHPLDGLKKRGSRISRYCKTCHRIEESARYHGRQ